MPRESIGMSTAEVHMFAETQRRGVLATVDADGPCGDIVRCMSREGRLIFAVAAGSRSHTNITRDNRVCCILEYSPAYYEIRGAMLHGAARVLYGAESERARTALAAWAGKDAALHDQVIFEIGLDDVVSFDFSKIKNRLPE